MCRRRLTLDDFLRRIRNADKPRWRVIVRQDPCCYCGSRVNMTMEHVWPRWRERPGGRQMAHIVGACRTCNHERGDESLLLFLIRRRAGRAKPSSKNQRRAEKRIEDRRRRTRVREAVPVLRASIGDQLKARPARHHGKGGLVTER